MKMKNLGRAAEIATVLPILKQARADLSNGSSIMVNDITLPQGVNYRFIQALNLEINELEKEITTL